MKHIGLVVASYVCKVNGSISKLTFRVFGCVWQTGNKKHDLMQYRYNFSFVFFLLQSLKKYKVEIRFLPSFGTPCCYVT